MNINIVDMCCTLPWDSRCNDKSAVFRDAHSISDCLLVFWKSSFPTTFKLPPPDANLRATWLRPTQHLSRNCYNGHKPQSEIQTESCKKPEAASFRNSVRGTFLWRAPMLHTVISLCCSIINLVPNSGPFAAKELDTHHWMHLPAIYAKPGGSSPTYHEVLVYRIKTILILNYYTPSKSLKHLGSRHIRTTYCFLPS